MANRTARIAPIHKKGDRLHVENYRPISLTSPRCKLIERIIAKSINKYLEEHSILTSYQHGSRRGYSTVTQLVTVVHSFASALDKNGQIDVIFFDFRKAFDTVLHDKLILKLENTGVPQMFISWISAYLHNRKQFVEINGAKSDSLPVTSLVPLGSVLGPFLFVLYINDIVKTVEGGVQIRLFADDCVLFNNVVSIHDQTNLCCSLDNNLAWSRHWGMTLNTDKSVLLRMTHKKSPLLYTYNLDSLPVHEVS